MTSPEYKEILTTESDGILTVTFNRPDRKNAMNPALYIDLINVLRWAKEKEEVRVVVLTGAGNFYSSGNDLSNFTTVDLSDRPLIEKLMADSKTMLEELVTELIVFPKILIAVVNGPSIGVGCTHLALCDFVFAVESAWFHTPFVALAQVPECCSSYTFPKLLGPMRANDVLLNGRKFTAKEAKEWGFVTDCFPTLGNALEAASEVAKMFSEAAVNSVLRSKSLIRSEEEINRLKKVAAVECDKLHQSWLDPELLVAVMKFMTRSRAKL